MLPSIKNLTNLKSQRVLVRVDFNVPLKEGKVSLGGEWRLRAVLPTLNYLSSQGAKIIILTHLGRPDGEKDLHCSLYPIFLKLAEIWPAGNLVFSPDVFGVQVKNKIKALQDGQAMLLENLRFFKEEKLNDKKFAKKLSLLGDFFVNDAFAVSHRAHASIVCLPKFLKSAAGFLLHKEIVILSSIRDKPRRPLVLIMGGAKAETKLKLVREFMPKSDHVILGGVLANTLLYAQGIAVGRSVVEKSLIKEIKDLKLVSDNLYLPVDVVISKSLSVAGEVAIKAVSRIGPREFIVDIGSDSRILFEKIVRTARMIIWNGPLGLTEVPAFKKGSLTIAQTIASGSAEKIIGGGDLVNFLAEENLLDRMDYVSTGGGAMIKFLAGEELPGIAALEQSKNNS